MVPFILTPREHHGVRTQEAYLTKHATFIAEAQRGGARYEVHDSPVVVAARVSGNQWVIDCECGAGNSVDPVWNLACCFGCGAIHRTVVVPPDWLEITRVLLDRIRPATRHWDPRESVEDLIAENVGVGLPDLTETIREMARHEKRTDQ